MKKILFTMMALSALVLMVSFAPQPVYAGTVILEGSDAIGYHCSGGDPSACLYRDQAFSAIGGSDSRPILVLGNTAYGNPVTSGTHAVVDMADLSTAGSLSNYVAIYFLATNGCCDDGNGGAELAGRGADVAAFLGAGGTIMIENYLGNAAWNDVMPGLGGGNLHIDGYLGSTNALGTCNDGETVTADGIANGFTQPLPMGCWTHQAYDMGYFGPLGFTHNFFNAPVAGYPTPGPWSSLLSSGYTVSAPEPASLLLIGSGLFALVIRRRK